MWDDNGGGAAVGGKVGAHRYIHVRTLAGQGETHEDERRKGQPIAWLLKGGRNEGEVSEYAVVHCIAFATQSPEHAPPPHTTFPNPTPTYRDP